MKHPDWPVFLAAIVAQPDDDTLRLVAADFLEDNGEVDRAAFIRLQLGYTTFGASGLWRSPEADWQEYPEHTYINSQSVFRLLWAAEECPELVHIPPPDRSGSPLAHLHVEGADRLVWRRGFVERVYCTAAEWLRHGVAVRSRNPVREVALGAVHAPSRDDWYAGLPALKGIPYLGMYQSRNNGDLTGWLTEWLPGTKIEAL